MRSQAYSLPTRIEEESGLNIEIHRQYIENTEGLDSTNGQPIRTEKNDHKNHKSRIAHLLKSLVRGLPN